jgi:hypothetical protein
MTTRRLAQALGLCAIVALGLFLIIASNPNPPGGGTPTPPAAPTLLSLEIPNDAFGNLFAGVSPTLVATTPTPANYLVLPLLPTTAPIVRVILDTPSNSTLTVTATDVNRATPTVTLPMTPASSPGPTTGYYQALNATSGWHIVIRYPNAFQGSKSIRTSISDTGGGVVSAPLTFDMSFSGSTLMVSMVTANNDGRVTSNPPGIDCPGVCNFDFLTASSVQLTQSVLRNQTEFTGWTGSCVGNGNSCTVSLFTGTGPKLPLNPSVTANFRIHTNTPLPPLTTCQAPPTLPGKQWVTQPNCGNAQFATLSCDSAGYFCCGAQNGTPSPRCSGQNLTPVTCSTSGLIGGPVNQQLIQPGGCYVTVP